MVKIFFRHKKHKINFPQTIAICGMGHNMGTTCLSLAISNYLCSKQLKSVAYIEVNSTDEIYQLNPKLKRENFKYMGIDFFPNKTISDLTGVINSKYEYFIMDFGVLNGYTAKEFNRCQTRFAICDHRDWKFDQIEAFLKNDTLWTDKLMDNLIIMGNISTSNCKKFRKEHGYDILSIPTIQNPFHLTSEFFVFFEELLKRSLYHNE